MKLEKLYKELAYHISFCEALKEKKYNEAVLKQSEYSTSRDIEIITATPVYFKTRSAKFIAKVHNPITSTSHTDEVDESAYDEQVATAQSFI